MSVGDLQISMNLEYNMLDYAKYYLETPLVFAWTIVIITFSICLERLMKYLFGRWKI